VFKCESRFLEFSEHYFQVIALLNMQVFHKRMQVFQLEYLLNAIRYNVQQSVIDNNADSRILGSPVIIEVQHSFVTRQTSNL
jgi:hypothetical protein